MNKKLLVMLTFLMLLASPMAASAALEKPGNEDTPAVYEVNFINIVSTDFTVVLNVNSPLIFNATGKSPKTNIEPDGQIAASSIPEGTITNGGDENQAFLVKLDSIPTNIVTKINGVNTITGAITLSTTAASPTQWEDVASEAHVDIYAWADFVGSVRGTRVANISFSSAIPGSGPIVPGVQVLDHVVITYIGDLEVPGEGSKTFTATAYDSDNAQIIGATFEWSTLASSQTSSTNEFTYTAATVLSGYAGDTITVIASHGSDPTKTKSVEITAP
jgi:hypothetical protein